MPRLAIKESCVFLVFRAAEAVGVMSAVLAIFVFSMSKSAPFALVRVTPVKRRVLKAVQVIVPKAFTVEHPSVDVLVRGAGDVGKRHARKSLVVVTTIRSVFRTRSKKVRVLKTRIVH